MYFKNDLVTVNQAFHLVLERTIWFQFEGVMGILNGTWAPGTDYQMNSTSVMQMMLALFEDYQDPDTGASLEMLGLSPQEEDNLVNIWRVSLDNIRFKYTEAMYVIPCS